MKRFAYDQHVLSLPKEFSELVSDMPKAVGSIGDTLHPSNKWELLPGIEGCWSSIDLPTFHTTALFESSEVQSLTELYSALCSVSLSDVDATQSFHKYKSCCICSKLVGSFKSRSNASSHVLVLWKSKYFGSSPGSNTSNDEFRPARINYFAKDTVSIKGHICLFHSIGSNTTLFRMCMENQCLYGSLIYLKCQELIASYLYNSFHLELSPL